MPEWAKESVQQLQDRGVLFVEDGNHGEYRPLAHEFVPQGVPFVRPPDLVGGRVDLSSCDQINQIALARVRKGIGRGGDVLFTHRATVGRLAIMPRDAPLFVCNPGVTVWRSLKPDVLDRRFLYYWMHAVPFMDQVWALAGGADTFPYIGLIQQRTLSIAVPPIDAQQAIAAVLGALDNKIELNRRMNRTLEAMARALFRSWFVDFDPVRAKAEGRAPAHMDPATAALFPARFGEDGLPEGWRRETIGQHVTVRKGLSYKGEGLCEEADGVPLHNLNSIYEGGGYKDEGIKFYRGEHKSRHEVRPGDLIVANTEQGFDELLIGHSALVPEWFGPSGIFSHHIYKLEPKAGSPLSREWWYLALSCSWIGVRIRSFSNGTTVNMLPSDAFELPAIPIPPKRIVQAMDSLVRPILRKHDKGRVENRTLAVLRDALLPKLMSGELRVRDAERALAEAF